MKIHDYGHCLPNTLCTVISLKKLNEHYCLINSSLTEWQEKQLLLAMEGLDSMCTRKFLLMVHLHSNKAIPTKSHVTRNECFSPLHFCSAGPFFKWERLASCKHRWQPSGTEMGKSGLEAQVLCGKAIWSWAMNSKVCIEYSPQNSLIDSFTYLSLYWVLIIYQLLC